MFENRTNLIGVRGCLAVAFLGLLASCGGGSGSDTATGASAGSGGSTNTGGSTGGSTNTGGSTGGSTNTGGSTSTTAPAVPGGLTSNAGNAVVGLSWTASSGATGYNVKRSTTSGGPYTQLAAPSAAAYTDFAVSNGTTYYYVVTALASGSESAASAQVSASPSAPVVAAKPADGLCGLTLASSATIFCDTFDAPAGIGNRAGDLNGNVWGVSRASGYISLGAPWYNVFATTQLVTCNGTTTVNPPNDVIICNGQLREATNDNLSGVFDAGGVTTLAMYPKQPFDFAGRTGTVSFDVSNDTHANHSSWPEFWLSDLPVPTPFNHFDSWIAFPQNGFGVRFAASALPGSPGLCPNLNNINVRRWTVDSAVVVRNYAYEDVNYQGLQFGTASATPLKLNILDCVIAPLDDTGVMNHVEVRVNQGQIDIYATDAGVAPTTATLKHIASITNANLTLTRGLIWIEDVHYNADKGDMPSQRQHTFVWDNVAFDGPFTYRDFSYDALDSLTPVSGAAGVNLGKYAQANQTATWNVPSMPANPQATAVRVLFNFHDEFNPNPTVLNVIVNGHAHSAPWPYPDHTTNCWRTFALTIPITDLVAGTNVVQLGGDQGIVTSNVNIVLVDVPGGVPVLPGNSTTYPGSN